MSEARDDRIGAVLDPLLVDATQIARLLDVSSRHVRRLADAGAMPASIKLGSLVRWRAADVIAWINSGCPRTRDRSQR